MAVTVENTATPVTNIGTSVTIPLTTTSATGVFAGAATNDKVANTATHNGDSMTKLDEQQGNGSTTRVSAWLLVPVDIGAGLNVVINFASSAEYGGSACGLLGIETSSVAAAHRTVYKDNPASAPTVTVTDSQSGDLVIDSAVTVNSTITVGAGQTSLAEVDNIIGDGFSWGMSTESATGASTVMSWTGGSASGTVATALIASSGGGGGHGQLLAFKRNALVV